MTEAETMSARSVIQTVSVLTWCLLTSAALAGDLRIAVEQLPQTLDPVCLGDSNAHIASFAFQRLFTPRGVPDSLPFQLPITDSNEFSVNRNQFTFSIRSGLRFSDGTPINSDIVAQNIQRFRTLFEHQFSMVQGIDIVDPSALTLSERSRR